MGTLARLWISVLIAGVSPMALILEISSANAFGTPFAHPTDSS